MLIKYRFSINGHYVNPVYKDDLSKDYALEPQQRFYRAELSGSLRFMREDFDWIMSQPFQTEYIVLVEKSSDGGITWVDYFTGIFFQADCQIDLDIKKIEVKLDTKDQYNEVLAGLEKEYDLLKLAPAKTFLAIQKRPLIQLYIPGSQRISCFMGGNSWEQDVIEPVTDTNILTQNYHFHLISTFYKFVVLGDGTVDGSQNYLLGDYIRKTGTYNWGRNEIFKLLQSIYPEEDEYGNPTGRIIYEYVITRDSDNIIVFSGLTFDNPDSCTLNAVSGSGASGSVVVYTFEPTRIYIRHILDLEVVQMLFTYGTYPIPTEDIVENNSNYKRILGEEEGSFTIYNDCITIYNYASFNPTRYGKADDGMYFQMPYNLAGDKFYPMFRSSWIYSSIWFDLSIFDWNLEEACRKTYTMKDSILISDAIKVLLNTIDPSIVHDGTLEYSQFLYADQNPIVPINFKLLITQKSNITAGEYDKPAQKAPITLSAILSMLRDTMQVYWYIEGNKFKLEHISWFKNGGSYSDAPVISFDLTQEGQIKNKKPWGFLSSKYSYDKVDMAERYEFGWMDDVTEGFKGFPIEVKSKYVQRGKIETISVSMFTSDVDYMLLNPGAISQDGFALFAAIWNSANSIYELPYLERTVDGAALKLQNGLMSFLFLHPNFWTYDLPSKNVSINGADYLFVKGVERKKKQKIAFPSLEDPNPLQLIKTYLGDGQIEKLSINLQSRMNDIELKYDTE